MRAMLLVILIILSANAFADTLDGAVRECTTYIPNTPDLQDDPDVFEQQIAKAMAGKNQVCKKADELLRRRERAVEDLKNVTAGLTLEEIDSPLAANRKRIEQHIERLQEIADSLSKIPDEVNAANNALFKTQNNLLLVIKAETAKLADTWDLLFLPTPNGPLAKALAFPSAPDLPEMLLASLHNYLNRLPPYLLGKGPAPRQDLESLQKADFLTSRIQELKNVNYVAKEKANLKGELQQALTPDYLRAKAVALRESMLRHFGNHTPNWARLAGAAGACESARSELSDQLDVLNTAVTQSPETFRPYVQQSMQKELDARNSALAQFQCNFETDSPRLSAYLGLLLQELPQACAHATPRRQEEIRMTISDISSWRANIASFQTVLEQRAFDFVGSDLWTSGMDLIQTCNEARP
jgi:DNA repair ATPase RecN